MQDIGAVGIDCECLLAANLGVEISSGPSMIKAGLMQRGGRVDACAACFGLGSEASGPTFAAVHRHIN